MIAKKKIGAGFRGALEYDLGKDGGTLLHTNLASTQPRAMAKEFGEIRKLRPNLKKAVLHVSISAAPGEKLSDAQWIAIGKKYLKAMGLDKNQFVITRHTDTDNEHIHILANRIRFDGTVSSDSNDYKRQETLMRELESEYAMTPVRSSSEAQIRPIKSGEIEKALRLNERPPRLVLQELVAIAATGKPDVMEFIRRLEVDGIGVVANIASTGKMNGFSFEFAGVAFSGSKLGEKFKWAELQKVIDYDQTRHSAELAARRDASRDNVTALEHGRIDVDDLDLNARNSAALPGAGAADALGRDQSAQRRDLDAPRAIEAERAGRARVDADAIENSGLDQVVRFAIGEHRDSSAAPGRQEHTHDLSASFLDRHLEEARFSDRNVEADREASLKRDQTLEVTATNLETSNDRRNRTAGRNRNSGKTLSQRDVERIRRVTPSRTVNSVQSMHGRRLDRYDGFSQVLLPHAVSTLMGGRRADSDYALRRIYAGGRSLSAPSESAASTDLVAAFLKQDKPAERRLVMDDQELPTNAKALWSVLAMRQVLHEAAQRASFHDFLRDLAADGNRHALSMLHSEGAEENSYSGSAKTMLVFDAELQRSLTIDGEVIYSLQGKEVLRDLGETVLVIDKSDAGLARGLRLAQAKFGGSIALHGSSDFIERNCFIAAKNGLDIEFKDPAHQAIFVACRESFKREEQACAEQARFKLQSDASWPGRPLGRLHDLRDEMVDVIDLRTAERRVDETSAAIVAAIARKEQLEKFGSALPLKPIRRPAAAVANGSAAAPKRKTYRHQMLEKTYGQSSENLAKYWRVDKSREGVVFSNRDGRIVDRGVSIHCDHGNGKEIEAMIDLAKIKGWKSLTMRGGSDDFKYNAMMASLRSGLEIVATTPGDKAILVKVQKDMEGIGGSGGSKIGDIGGGGHATAPEKSAADASAALALRMSTMLGSEDRRKEARRSDKKIRPK